MARGTKLMTEDVIAEMVRKGYGRGRLGSYIPWIHILDFYGEGRTHEPFSHRFGRRTHQLLSDGELRMFKLLEWAPDVADVREQFPLPRDITLEVARSLGIIHKYYPGTGVPYVMALDFLVDRVRDGNRYLQAFNVKPQGDLDDPEVINELEVARATCEGMDIEHYLVVSEDLKSSQKLKNIAWIRDAQLDEDATEPFPGFFEDHKSRMLADMRARSFDGILVDYCSSYDRRYSVEKGTGLRVVRMLLQAKALSMDLNVETPEAAHFETFHISALLGQPQVVAGGKK